MSRVQGNIFWTFSGKLCFPTYFWIVPTIVWTNIFRKHGRQMALWPKCQVKKVSCIDLLVMRFSLKSELLIGNFHQQLTCFVKPYFLFLQYRKSVLKKTQIFGPLFEPCSSCVAVDFFFQKKDDFWRKETP